MINSNILTMRNENEYLSTLCEYNDTLAAEITAAMLRSNGIDATVAGGVSSYPCMNLVDPVKVMVRESDLDVARKLLDSN